MNESLFNQTDNVTLTSVMTSSPMTNDNTTVTSSMTSSITPMTIAAVSVVMVISTVAVFMNSGILLMTYALKLIRKDYRMIYYVLITATDLTFSIHSVINCATIIFREIEFFKYKWFCLILQCSGVVSYQISAMSIILLVFDLFVSIRNPFNTETTLRRRLSYAACFVAIFIAISLAYGPFIWWYGNDRRLDFCSIANVYGPYFTDYHKMATVVLAALFILMIITSSLLLREIKISIQPRRLKSLKIPKIFKETTGEGREKEAKLSDNNTVVDEKQSVDQQVGKKVDDTALPDVVTDVEKVTMNLSNYVGIDNKAFDKEERMSVRNKLLNIDTSRDADPDGCAPLDEENPSVAQNQYTEAYKHVAGIETTIREESVEAVASMDGKKLNNETNTVGSDELPGCVNNGFHDETEQHDAAKGANEKGHLVDIKLEPSSPGPTTTEDIDEITEDKHRLSVDNNAPYRGSLEKVRRLTGTEINGAAKEIQAAQSEKRKKFIRACTTVAAFTTAFLGCGLPYYILSAVELSQGTASEDSEERRTVRMICALFLYILPIVDPILYTSRFQIIRQTIYKYLPKCCKCGHDV